MIDLVADTPLLQVIQVVTDPPWYENCFLLRHKASRTTIAIDPGSNADLIQAAAAEYDCVLTEIWLTHGHPDHVGAVRPLQDALDLPCRAHRDELPLLKIVTEYGRRRLGLEVESPRDIQPLDESSALLLADLPVQIIATPGHTPGGVVFAVGGQAFTGDTLFNQGIGRTDLPGGNGRQLAESLTKLAAALPPDTQIHCGHGPAWTIGAARPWLQQILRWGV